MTGRTGIISLDDESDAFREACVRLVQTSMLRRLVADLAIDMGLDLPHESIIHVARDLARWVIWGVDSDGRPVMGKLGNLSIDDFARLTIKCEEAGILTPLNATEP